MLLQGQEPSNAADQDAATRTASSSAPGSTSSPGGTADSTRSPDGPTATHFEADPEMAGGWVRESNAEADEYYSSRWTFHTMSTVNDMCLH